MNQLVFENFLAMMWLIVTICNEGNNKREKSLVPIPLSQRGGVLIRANPDLELR